MSVGLLLHHSALDAGSAEEIAASGFAAGVSFGAPSTDGSASVAVSALDASAGFGASTLAAGGVERSAGAVDAAAGIGAPSLSAVVSFAPMGLAAEASFGSPSGTVGLITILVEGADVSVAFGAPVVTRQAFGVYGTVRTREPRTFVSTGKRLGR